MSSLHIARLLCKLNSRHIMPELLSKMSIQSACKLKYAIVVFLTFPACKKTYAHWCFLKGV